MVSKIIEVGTICGVPVYCAGDVSVEAVKEFIAEATKPVDPPKVKTRGEEVAEVYVRIDELSQKPHIRFGGTSSGQFFAFDDGSRKDLVLSFARENLAKLIDDERADATKSATNDFKNFHRSLCNRFGYFHDETSWARDLMSLEEHIARAPERAMRAERERCLRIVNKYADSEMSTAQLRANITDAQ